METKAAYIENHVGIKQLAEDDRPREKLVLRGRQFLSNAELLAILIGTGTTDNSAVDLGKRVLQLANNNLNKLGKLSVSELKTIKGIGEAKAIAMIAALELGRRRKEEAAQEVVKITCSLEAYIQFEPILEDLPHEEFWILFLGRNNAVMGKRNISIGGVSGTVADPKIIFKHAIDAMASGIVLCHNHPSGSCTPSAQDIQLTRKLVDAGRFLDIYVSDHIIIGHKKYYSFADNGLIYR
ncbi:MAG: DNA repair protein RadC [Bacteroidota bacterium]|nr:DNA repair protein RadC [Bacteroidota bacterium]